MKKRDVYYILCGLFGLTTVFGPFMPDTWNKGIGAGIFTLIICAALAYWFYRLAKKTDPEARFGKPKDETKQNIKTIKALKNYTVLDIETTGFSPTEDEIIEVGAVRVRNNKIVDSFSTLIHSNTLLSPKIVELTGITDEMLLTAPTLNEVMPEFKKFLSTDTIIGHNIIKFDSKFISQAFLKTQQGLFENALIDTLPISQAMYPDWPKHRLLDLIKNFNIADTENHRALDDATQNMQVFEIMKQQLH